LYLLSLKYSKLEFRQDLSTLNKIIFSTFLFGVAFVLGPLRQLEFLANMPGDIIDSRLNNYFLENIYQYLQGRSASLLHLGFFYPYPFVGGFSDNLFGASPIYLTARYLRFSSDGAFQIWYLTGFFVNFLAAYAAIKKFGQSHSASTLAAIFFTFGLPVTAQIGHPQLQYRFGIPLAIVYFYQFIEAYNWRALLVALFWLYWQFLCSIYLGFFAALYMIMMIISALLYDVFWQKNSASLIRRKESCNKYFKNFILVSNRYKTLFFISIVFLILVFYGLFYPYLKVSSLYHFSRQWIEVSAMLPRLGSYLLADNSELWGAFSQKIKGIPIRWEQQLFIGFTPLLLIIVAIFVEKTLYLTSKKYFCLLVSFAILVTITINYNNCSLWYFFHFLPLFSAIRAVSRIELLFLFPISIFLAAAIDLLLKKKCLPKPHFLILFSSILVIENSAVRALTSTKSEWRQRLSNKERGLEKNYKEGSILFFSQSSFSFESEELDAMLVAHKRNLPTLNGYSGAMPPHFHAFYGDDCAEYPRRIIFYLDFMGEEKNKEAYREIARRVLPIGFTGCAEAWRSDPPMTIADRALKREEISQLSLELAPKHLVTPAGYLWVRIVNHGEKQISALSRVDQDLRLAWRLIGVDGQPKAAWSAPRAGLPVNSLPQGYRRGLPGDIAAKGFIDVLVQIPEKTLDKYTALEFSIIQEATLWGFSLNEPTNIWGHDVGVAPLIVNIASP